jgi:hypothetical protein
MYVIYIRHFLSMSYLTSNFYQLLSSFSPFKFKSFCQEFRNCSLLFSLRFFFHEEIPAETKTTRQEKPDSVEKSPQISFFLFFSFVQGHHHQEHESNQNCIPNPFFLSLKHFFILQVCMNVVSC